MCVRALYILRCASTISLSHSLSLSLSLSLARSIARSRSSVSCSRTARTYAGVYAGISQRAANLWSREARFNPLRLVSGYSFRLRPASDGTLIRSPRLSESARSLSSWIIVARFYARFGIRQRDSKIRGLSLDLFLDSEPLHHPSCPSLLSSSIRAQFSRLFIQTLGYRKQNLPNF